MPKLLDRFKRSAICAMSACLATANRLRRDNRGNIAMIFGIVSVPLISSVGAAVDYTRAATLRSKLTNFQDMAVLSALSKVKVQTSASQAQSDAIDFFNAQVAAAGLKASISLTVTDANNVRNVSSTFTSEMDTAFVNIMGFPQMTVSNTSTGQLNVPVFIDFYLLLDNTPSMGLGATMSDITALQSLTPQQCAFACHDLSNSNSNYAIARNSGVTLRIDVVRQATQNLTDRAAQTASFPNQFRMGVYTFGSACRSPGGVTTISTLDSNMSNVKAATNAIDLMTIPRQNYLEDQCTDFDSAFAAMNSTIPSSGTGSSASPQKFLFYVSDGVADAANPGNCSQPFAYAARCQEPLKTSDCDALKARGIKIAVLYTTYLPLDTTGVSNDGVTWYINTIKPFSSQIATNMKACASDGYYFEVSPTQGISDAMNALFNKAVGKARLTG